MEYLGNISFVKIESSKLINYATHMCWSDQGTMVVVSYLFPVWVLVLLVGLEKSK
jgi:hypothetical protein